VHDLALVNVEHHPPLVRPGAELVQCCLKLLPVRCPVLSSGIAGSAVKKSKKKIRFSNMCKTWVGSRSGSAANWKVGSGWA
jgi:hypothetical protein